jgi:hypothetical protein
VPTTAVNTYSATRCVPIMDGKSARQLSVNVAASTTLQKGHVVGEVSASPGTYAAYATGNVDGTQNPKGIMQFGLTTDASKNITSFGDWGATTKDTPIWVSGVFDIADLYDSGSAGILAATVTALEARVIEGVASGGRYTSGLLLLG